MIVRCEWITCKYNTGGMCQAESIELKHIDDDDVEKEQFEQALVCQQYEWGKNDER